MEPVVRIAVLKRVKDGSASVLDVRQMEKYKTGHIPGAQSIPPDQLKELLAILPRSPEIIACCREPACVLSVEAVEILRSKGLHAVGTQEGGQNWQAM